jgi:hypothetical protein
VTAPPPAPEFLPADGPALMRAAGGSGLLVELYGRSRRAPPAGPDTADRLRGRPADHRRPPRDPGARPAARAPETPACRTRRGAGRARPPLSVTAHREAWVTGLCRRRESTDRPALWPGPVQTDHGTGAFHACERCITRLEAPALAGVERPVSAD